MRNGCLSLIDGDKLCVPLNRCININTKTNANVRCALCVWGCVCDVCVMYVWCVRDVCCVYRFNNSSTSNLRVRLAPRSCSKKLTPTNLKMSRLRNFVLISDTTNRWSDQWSDHCCNLFCMHVCISQHICSLFILRISYNVWLIFSNVLADDVMCLQRFKNFLQ